MNEDRGVKNVNRFTPALLEYIANYLHRDGFTVGKSPIIPAAEFAIADACIRFLFWHSARIARMQKDAEAWPEERNECIERIRNTIAWLKGLETGK